MADTKAKPAAKKAATSTSSSSSVSDKQADKAFGEPDEYKGVDVPSSSLSPAESLKRDQENAKQQEDLHKLERKQADELEEVADYARQGWDGFRRSPRETVGIVDGIEDGQQLGIHSGNGRVTLTVGKEKVVLDREGAINLGRQVDEAFQAVA